MHIYDVYHFFYNIMKTTYQNCRQNKLRDVSVLPTGKWMARINQSGRALSLRYVIKTANREGPGIESFLMEMDEAKVSF